MSRIKAVASGWLVRMWAVEKSGCRGTAGRSAPQFGSARLILTERGGTHWEPSPEAGGAGAGRRRS